MREFEAIEYQSLMLPGLTRPQRDVLLGCGGDFALTPEPGTDDSWRLRCGSKVGTVVAPGLTIRIRPKITIARLFEMLSAATSALRWSASIVGLSPTSTVEDVVAAVFIDAVQKELARGLLRGYIALEEESFVARGRLEVSELIRRRPMTLAPLVQTPEFLEENIPENQVLASALDVLARRIQSQTIRTRLMDCQRAFVGVSRLRSGRSLPRIARNRLNARWWGAIELALLVLRSGGLDLPIGDHLARSFLIDMNVVFERFVYRALAEDLLAHGLTLHDNHGGIRLDTDGLHTLRPDLSLWRGDRCTYAGDCKYKQSTDAMAQRDDMYQCVAYAVATGLPRITLFYGGESPQSREVQLVDGRTTVLVRVLDLSAPTVRLQAQCAALAREAADLECLLPLATR